MRSDHSFDWLRLGRLLAALQMTTHLSVDHQHYNTDDSASLTAPLTPTGGNSMCVRPHPAPNTPRQSPTVRRCASGFTAATSAQVGRSDLDGGQVPGRNGRRGVDAHISRDRLRGEVPMPLLYLLCQNPPFHLKLLPPRPPTHPPPAPVRAAAAQQTPQ